MKLPQKEKNCKTEKNGENQIGSNFPIGHWKPEVIRAKPSNSLSKIISNLQKLDTAKWPIKDEGTDKELPDLQNLKKLSPTHPFSGRSKTRKGMTMEPLIRVSETEDTKGEPSKNLMGRIQRWQVCHGKKSIPIGTELKAPECPIIWNWQRTRYIWGIKKGFILLEEFKDRHMPNS